MKKSAKPVIIISSIAAAAVIAFAVVKLGFPGISSYRIVKKVCPYIDNTAVEYPFYNIKTPDDFMGSGASGLSFDLPAEVQVSDMYSDLVVYSDGVENGVVVMVYPKEIHEKSDFTIGDDSEIWANFCIKTFGSAVQSYYDMLDVQFKMTMDDLNIHNKADADMFKKLAVMKDENIITVQDIYSFQTENGKGFVYFMGESDGQFHYAVELFPKNDGNEGHLISISSDDDEKIKQIINSIDIILK